MTWLCGEFATARSHLERARAGQTAADRHDTDAVWFIPIDPVATARIHLALVGLVRGDLSGARPSWRTRHAGSNNSAFRKVPTASPTRAGRRAGCAWKPVSLTAPQSRLPTMTDVAERHGFDSFRELGVGM